MTIVLLKIFSHREKRAEHFDSHSFSIIFISPWDVVKHSMKMIHSVNYSDSLLNDRNSWTLLQSCNVVKHWKIFHTNSILSFRRLSCIVMNLWTIPIVAPRQVFDCGFPLIFPRNNTEFENTWTFAYEKRMTSSSSIKDKCFHEKSSQVDCIHSMDLIWLPSYQLFKSVKHPFHWKILSYIFDGM